MTIIKFIKSDPWLAKRILVFFFGGLAFVALILWLAKGQANVKSLEWCLIFNLFFNGGAFAASCWTNGKVWDWIAWASFAMYGPLFFLSKIFPNFALPFINL